MPPRPTQDLPPEPANPTPEAVQRSALMRLAAHLALSQQPWSHASLKAALEAAALGWGASRVALWRAEEGGALVEVAAWPPRTATGRRPFPPSWRRALGEEGASTTWRTVPGQGVGAWAAGEIRVSPILRAGHLLGALARQGGPAPDAGGPSPWEATLIEALGAVLAHNPHEPDAPPCPDLRRADLTGELPAEAMAEAPRWEEPSADLVVRWTLGGRLTHVDEATSSALGLGLGDRWPAEALGDEPPSVVQALLEDPRGLGAVTRGTLPTGLPVRWNHVLAAGGKVPGGSVVSVGHVLASTDRARRHLESAWAAVHAVAARAVDADERVRREVGSELHDVAAQHLTAALLRLQLLASDEARRAYAEPLHETARELEAGIRALRSASRSMAAHTLRSRGLSPALAELADRLTRWHRIPCEFTEQGAPVPLVSGGALALFRSVAELLANVARHADAERCHVTLRWGPKGALVEVIDDGIGLQGQGPRATPGTNDGGEDKDRGLGLFTVRARLRQVGGGLQLGMAPGGGTRAAVFIPRGKNGRPTGADHQGHMP